MDCTRVESVEEAVRVANQLMQSGKTYWFRGQSNNWSLKSSLIRVPPADRKLVLEKMARYEQWINRTPGLEDLASNPDAAIAVAQHYGIPTNFVDFTTKPEIAGFFASQTASGETAGGLGCILYLDIQDFLEFWETMGSRYRPPELLEIKVPDLWRLEAQHGCFLFCPYDEVEKLYDFDRILFPIKRPLGSIPREAVYPSRKSHLEVLLDQFFMNERMINNQLGRPWTEARRVVVEKPAHGCEPEVFPRGIPEHKSWAAENLRPWLKLREEQYGKVHTSVNFQILVTHPRDSDRLAREVAHQIEQDLLSLTGIRNKLVGWQVKLADNSDLPPNFASELGTRLDRLWDGLRQLPHSDTDLSLGFGLCVAFATILKGDFQNPKVQDWELAASLCMSEPIRLEFGADDGSYSRGFASKSSLASAIRPDLNTFVAAKFKQPLDRNVKGILQTAWNPKLTFDFDLLSPLFAREIAPYQVLARDSAVFYSPARLVSLGLP